MSTCSLALNLVRRSWRGLLVTWFALAVLGPALPVSGAETTAPAQPVGSFHEAGSAVIEGDTRAVVPAADGTIVAGSNTLGVFDGTAWQKIEAGNAYGFRALAAEPRDGTPRVWVGAIGEIGFIAPDKAKTWRYTSLLPELARAGLPALRDVWSVHVLDDAVIWITTERVLRRTTDARGRGGFEIWELPSPARLAAFDHRNSILIHQEGVGLLRLGAAGEPSLVVPEAGLPATPVTWLVSSDRPPGVSLIGLGDRVYRWTEAGAHFEFLPDLSRELAGTLPTDAVSLDDGRIAIATFNAGITLAATDGRPLHRFARGRGLVDDSVYSISSHDGDLWAASPGGLLRLEGAGQVWLFDRHDSLEGGRTIAVAEHRGAAYLLTSKALFRSSDAADSAGNPLELVLRAPGLFTDCTPVGDDLWVSGFGGLWRISDGEATQEHFVSTDVLAVSPTSRLARGVLFLEGYRLKALVPSPRGGWSPLDLGAAVSDSPIALFEDTRGDVWVSTMQEGIVRFGWDASATATSPRLRWKGTYRPGVGLPADAGRARLVPLGARLFAFTDAGILGLRDDELVFEPLAEFAGLTGIGATRPRPAGPDAGHWLVQSRALAGSDVFAVLKADARAAGAPTLAPLFTPGLSAAGTPSLIGFTSGPPGDALWIGGTHGLQRVSAAALHPAPPAPRPDVWVAPDPGHAGTFDFRFSATGAGAGALFFQSKLDGAEAGWSPPQRPRSRVFGGLGAGDYRFEVRALDRFGRVGPTASVAFQVAAPWWKTPAALAGGAVLFGLLVMGAARWQVARLRRQNERLNRLVAERTREIELASTAKSEFLDNVSHEIRNPLNGLTGLLAMLKEERLDPRERELTRSLKSVAATLTQVFEDVLQFSKLEYGYGRLERRPFALRPVLEEVLALFAAQARQAGCALRLDWPAGLADGFEGDPEKIKTIVANFVGNALKYAPGAPVDIRVEATAETDGLVDLYLDVIDHGPGVPPDEQELIFRKFVRGRRAQESRLAGTGLGLATCRMLAKMMNGSVGIEATPGGGSTFHLKLLLPRAQLSDTDAAAPAAASGAAGGGAMLIVDDEPYNRVVLEGIAWELGCIADAAGSAEEALERLATRDYAVVLLDWELPGAKGGDVARAVCRRDTGDNEPPVIIATTAHDSEEMRARCREAGMEGFLPKPYNAAAVRQAIAAARAVRARSEPHHAAAFAPPPDGGELDLSAFDHYRRARPGGVDDARDLFVEAVASQAKLAATAVAERNPTDISRAAHRLRALSGMVRAVELNHAAARLEQAAREGSLVECMTAWTATREACDALRERLGMARDAASR